MAHLTAAQTWKELDRCVFMVVGMVNARGQGRTAGVVPAVHHGAIWFSTLEHDWKTRHIIANGDVSVTVPVPRRIPLVPIRIPAATITFTGRAEVMALDDPSVPAPVVEELSDVDIPADSPRGRLMGVRIVPTGDFVTYGIGIPVWRMRDVEAAQGRVPHARDRTAA